jgi:hypothetical protein
MAWSPFQRANAGIIGVEQPGDYANPIPTTSATGPYPITQYRIGRRDVDATLGKVVSVSENRSGRYLISGARAFARAMAGKIIALGVPPTNILSDDFRRLRIQARRQRTSRRGSVE